MKLPAEKVKQLRSAFEGKAVCVTGGAGFIGGHLVDTLLALGASVIVIDDLSNSTFEHLSGLIELEPGRVRFVHGSILDDDALADAVKGCALVFHFAAMGSVPRSIEDPRRSFAVNATGTLRVLAASKAAGVQRVIYAASSSAYGDDPSLPRVETQPPRALSPYAAGKLAGEHLMTAWASSAALSTVSLRFFNVFGPRQPADSPYAAVIPAFALRLLNGEAPVIHGDGTQSRDFTYVANAVLASLLAAAAGRALAGEVVNVGTGARLEVARLATLMAQLLGRPHLQPTFVGARAGDVRHSQADINRARQLLGYEPVARLEEGLAETVEWYRQSLVSK